MTNSCQDFLIEIGTEELPPKALLTLSEAFHQSLVQQLGSAKLSFESSQSFATPRRLAVRFRQLDSQQADQQVERRGPAVAAAFDAAGEPTKALQGFARSCQVDVSDLDRIETDKGQWVVYRSTQAGQRTQDLLPEFVQTALAQLPIPKRMRWGSRRVEFVRPVHWIVMIDESTVITCEILGLKAGRSTLGHRFHAPQAVEISKPADYEHILKKACVVADFEERKEDIRTQVLALAEDKGGRAVIDEDLLNEVTALNEYPHALLGRFEERFLEVPQEALISTMKENQKYFHLIDDQGRLLPFFITVSNIKSKEPEKVIQGNERVVRPRLSDAAFFFETDKKTTLDGRLPALGNIIFQKQLGTLLDRSERISALASRIAEFLKVSRENAARAGLLSKADLVSAMVLEFPELQGIMGRYYAELSGENPEVSQAIQEHYLPRFSGDVLPETATGVAVSLAEKLDTLSGIFGINQPPTGTKDPFALRRAALSVLRLLIEKEIDISIPTLIDWSLSTFTVELPAAESLKETVSHYILERLKAWYEEQGVPTEVYLSVMATGVDNPVQFNARVKAVTEFLSMEAAKSLIAANKRVANILDKETATSTAVDISLFSDQAEKALWQVVENCDKDISAKVAKRDYTGVLKELASLKEPVDRFFDEVMVMADDSSIKANRIAILKSLRGLFLNVADISLLQGLSNRSQ